MNKIQISFGKEMTAMIKGVAIIFMIVLHVFCGPNWYDSKYIIPLNSNETLLHYGQSLNVCVGIYVFMIGFGYFFSKDKDYHYCITHCKKLLTVYWPILFLMALPVGYKAVLSGNSNGGLELIANAFGIEKSLLWVNWFVYLYIWAMIVMPFIARFINKKMIPRGIIVVIISYGLIIFERFVFPSFIKSPLGLAIAACLAWTPTIIVGYVFAAKRYYERIRIPRSPLTAIISVAVIIVTLYLKSICDILIIFKFDIFYAPIIIDSLLVLFSLNPYNWIKKIFTELGDKSVYMWFIHGLFFTASTRVFYQPIIMISDNLWIIAVWTIIVSYLISWPIKKIIDIK